jgi:hypothetical protein
MLNKSREVCGILRTKTASVDFSRNGSKNVGAAPRPITANPVAVSRLEAVQNPRSMQKVMNQGVDGNHLAACLEPIGPRSGRRHQDLRKGHGEHFIGNPKYAAHRNHECLLPDKAGLGAYVPDIVQLSIDPAEKIAACDVADKEIEAVCRLIQSPVPQPVSGNGAFVLMIRRRTCSASLVVTAPIKSPVIRQKGTCMARRETGLHFLPRDATMLV